MSGVDLERAFQAPGGVSLEAVPRQQRFRLRVVRENVRTVAGELVRLGEGLEPVVVAFERHGGATEAQPALGVAGIRPHRGFERREQRLRFFRDPFGRRLHQGMPRPEMEVHGESEHRKREGDHQGRPPRR